VQRFGCSWRESRTVAAARTADGVRNKLDHLLVRRDRVPIRTSWQSSLLALPAYASRCTSGGSLSSLSATNLACRRWPSGGKVRERLLSWRGSYARDFAFAKVRRSKNIFWVIESGGAPWIGTNPNFRYQPTALGYESTMTHRQAAACPTSAERSSASTKSWVPIPRAPKFLSTPRRASSITGIWVGRWLNPGIKAKEDNGALLVASV
jgi:hypothetical protein